MSVQRWKYLRDELPDGRCRDCGHHDPHHAPDACARCAKRRYREQGFFSIDNPVAAFEQQFREKWRLLAQAVRAGQVPPNRFFVWIGHGDGGPLERAGDEVLPEREFVSSQIAHETALDLMGRYPEVWVVTSVGCWAVTSGPGGREEDHDHVR